jgi:hypothetical protein
VHAAVARVEAIATTEVRAYTASAHAELYPMDLAFVSDVLRHFVRRDLTARWAAGTRANSLTVRTRLVDVEVTLGGARGALDFTADGVTFRLAGKLDRVEEVADPRLPEAVQGWLVLRDYKTGGPRWTIRPDTHLRNHLEGKHLQLPLYAAMAERHYGRRVFGFGELFTFRDVDPPMIAVGRLAPRGEGVALERTLPDGDAVRTVVDITVARAAAIVGQMRAGAFAPHDGRTCYGCHLRAVCRASLAADPARGRARARMPLAVDLDEYVAAGRVAALASEGRA